MVPFSGWKRTAIYLTGLVTTLTTLLIVMLFVSLFALQKDDPSDDAQGANVATDALGQSLLYKGNCDTTAKANLWIHLAINIIGTGVLASSNFFMQSLVAPTRAEVDAAHSSGRWLEIGVQSLKNFGFLGWRKILFWSLFSLSSVPLHLVFNGCVLESKGTNGFTLLLGTEDLASGGWTGLKSISSAYLEPTGGGGIIEDNETLKRINKSLTSRETYADWERIDFADCMDRYNDPEKSLTHWRHVIMVMYDYNDIYQNSTKGWKRSEVLKNTTALTHLNDTNPLWTVDTFLRNGKLTRNGGSGQYISNPDINYIGPVGGVMIEAKNTWSMQGTNNFFDPVSGLLVMDRTFVEPEHQVMQVDHCVSEKYEAPCRLTISNSLLLIVCIMCAFKCALCFLVLKLRVWGNESPLMTPGDAIASFIARPDEETKGMCTLSMEDFKNTKKPTQAGLGDVTQNYKWLQGPRQWQTNTKHRFGKAVPLNIWVLSSLLIGTSLIVAGVLMVIAIRGQPLGDSRFGHAPQNEDVSNQALDNLPLISLTMVANLPQLVLSICYLSYNGLFTRMLAEFEWSKHSVGFRSLRVTDPKGKQNSTYRLQLPYRFSIPLIIVSIALHWINSNCIYVSNYEAYTASYPYKRQVTISLQFSSKAILIALVVSICVAIVPVFLAFVKLPGIMVIAGANSAVISAACHYPSVRLKTLSRASSKLSRVGSEYDSMSARLIRDDEVEELEAVARRKVKWGRISTGKSDDSQVGHLGFGTDEHDITKPVEGEHYSGT
ncbi:hypothetical protein FSARC_13569 [Fusarium sarcochroum]|uniref:DUF6536 domain-containing protein n=1 Tax=Fusarium sarcochroum TaxID=1208366 RepID=A0A8H4T0L9_9HYPO|nr:hypothetical protein FSARC_13569 [Fusarium sarcochroum]